MKKISIQVTPAQLNDLIHCVEMCLDRSLGYGHITVDQMNIPEFNRKRILQLLEKSK